MPRMLIFKPSRSELGGQQVLSASRLAADVHCVRRFGNTRQARLAGTRREARAPLFPAASTNRQRSNTSSGLSAFDPLSPTLRSGSLSSSSSSSSGLSLPPLTPLPPLSGLSSSYGSGFPSMSPLTSGLPSLAPLNMGGSGTRSRRSSVSGYGSLPGLPSLTSSGLPPLDLSSSSYSSYNNSYGSSQGGRYTGW